MVCEGGLPWGLGAGGARDRRKPCRRNRAVSIDRILVIRGAYIELAEGWQGALPKRSVGEFPDGRRHIRILVSKTDISGYLASG